MSADRILVMCGGSGHLNRLLPVVDRLVRRGRRVTVMTRAGGRTHVEALGAEFVDLFDRPSEEEIDSTSVPMPSRQVSFAAVHAAPLTEALQRWGAKLLIYDSFVVVAPIVARRLGIPYVSARAGHAQVPRRAEAEVRADPRVRISRLCERAAQRLRDRGDLPDASPFSYLHGLSPHLNLYPEPPSFLSSEDRAELEPLVFFGCLAPRLRALRADDGVVFPARERRRRIYASFGTVVWRYYESEALAALRVLSEGLSPSCELLISLGGHGLDAAARASLERPHVRVETYVDQWRALEEADCFVTHHGLSSTHEAIYHRIPMLGRPFFGDQPKMAATCRARGLSEPLVLDDVAAQVARVVDDAEVKGRLEIAREEEQQVIEARGQIIDRLLALVDG